MTAIESRFSSFDPVEELPPLLRIELASESFTQGRELPECDEDCEFRPSLLLPLSPDDVPAALDASIIGSNAFIEDEEEGRSSLVACCLSDEV